MLGLKSKSDRDREREALAEQVHGVERTCAVCGARRSCAVGAVRIMPGLDGAERVFGVCPECVGVERRGEVLADAVATVLGVEVDPVLLAGVTVDRFADLPHHRPDRPARDRWGHLDADRLGRQIDDNRKDVERRTGGPCRYCGVTITPAETGWRAGQGRGDLPECGSCQHQFDTAVMFAGYGAGADPLRRTFAAQRLAKLDRSACGVRTDIGFGQESGLLFFHESGRKKGGTHPWAHLDWDAFDARAAELLASPYHADLRPPGWTPGWRPDRTRKVMW